MARYWETFGDLPTGVGAPAFLTLYGPSATYNIVENAGAINGKYLSIVHGSTGDIAAIYAPAGSPSTDTEILFKWRAPTVGFSRSIAYLRFTDMATHYENRRTVNATDFRKPPGTISGGFSLPAIDTAKWYWTRARATSSGLFARHWEDGTAEPGSWTTSVTSPTFTDYTSGGIGLGFTNETLYVDYLSVGTNGDAAPNPPDIYEIPGGALGITPLEPKIDKFINVPTGRIGIARLKPQTFPKFVPPGNLGITGIAPRATGRIRLEMPAAVTGLAPQAPTVLQVFRTAFIPAGQLGLTGIAPLGVQFLESSVTSTATASDSTVSSLIAAMLGVSAGEATDTAAAIGEFLSGITDRTVTADTAQAIGEFPLAYTDTVDAVDTVGLTFLLQYADSGDVSDALGLTFLLAFRELVAAVDEIALTGEYPLTVSSTGSISDALGIVLPLYLESTADGADTLDITRLLSVVSSARAQASSLSTLEITLALATLAHAQDAIDWARLSTLADSGEALGDVAALVTAASRLGDVADATDATSWTLALFVQLADTAEAADTVTLSVEALAHLLSQGHAVTLALSLDETEERYTGRVMNTETGALSWYTNVPFTALAWDTHSKALFALKADGLYVFDADDDAGTAITATLTTGVLDFQTDLLKRIDSAFIGHAGGRLLLQVHTTMGGAKQTHTYQMVPVTADMPRESVIKIGKGLQFSYCQFTLQNVDGADFEIDRMSVYPVTLSRRRSS